MYKIIKTEEIRTELSIDLEDMFFDVIKKELMALIEKEGIPKKALIGGMVLQDIPLPDGTKKNIWLSYNAVLISADPLVALDVGIHKCIVYDEIPDELLDEYNKIQKILNNG